MSYNFGSNKMSAVEAKFEAQKISFGPIMFQAAKALRDLGILEYVEKNRKEGVTIQQVAEATNVSEYGAKVLLEAGLSLKIVYAKDRKFFATKIAWFLLKDELTKVNMDFTQDVNYLGFFELEKCIQTGKPEGLKVFGEWDTVYEALSQLPPKVQESWFNFDHYYSDIAFPEILPILFENKPKKVMDVGGNTGKFSLKCAEYSTDVEITILDLPGQLAKAQQNIEAKGFQNRITGHPINLLDHSIAYPTAYDIVWMSQFLDCFSQEDIVQLLLKAKAALNENGAVYILETYWDQQKYEASSYALTATSLYFTCIANGCSQMYHHEDMLKLIDRAGMKVEKEYLNIGVSHTLYKCVGK